MTATDHIRIDGVIFDLDGVILSTDNYHYLAWKALAEREGIYFDRTINERLRGVSRMESLAIILEKANKNYSDSEKIQMAEYKNEIYKSSLSSLTPKDIFPGVRDLLGYLLRQNIKIAIGSSSKNTKTILEKINLSDLFTGAVSDGTNITRSKPDPEVFVKAAEMIEISCRDCLVVEDADAGIEAAKAAGMYALGVGFAKSHPRADFQAESLKDIKPEFFRKKS